MVSEGPTQIRGRGGPLQTDLVPRGLTTFRTYEKTLFPPPVTATLSRDRPSPFSSGDPPSSVVFLLNLEWKPEVQVPRTMVYTEGDLWSRLKPTTSSGVFVPTLSVSSKPRRPTVPGLFTSGFTKSSVPEQTPTNLFRPSVPTTGSGGSESLRSTYKCFVSSR